MIMRGGKDANKPVFSMGTIGDITYRLHHDGIATAEWTAG